MTNTVMKRRYNEIFPDACYRLFSKRLVLYFSILSLVGLLIGIICVCVSLSNKASPCGGIIREAYKKAVLNNTDQEQSFSSGLNERCEGLNVNNGKHLTLNGEKIQILSGAMHYFRIPHQYWYDRLVKLKAAGLNTVETYVAWNMHEQEPGKFDFSGQLDLIRYITLARDLGLYVILRPGPYIAAEWDWGGLPAWLLEDGHMQIRSIYNGYTQAVDRYFSKLIPQLTPLQYTNGGNVIAVQVENEYGSYDSDKEYLAWCKNVLVKYGITELLFTADGGELDLLHNGTLPGVFAVVNFQEYVNESLAALESFQPNKPLMVGEFWSGWFDHWGEGRHVLPLSNFTESVENILSRGASINFYMFHGGTNFGFMNGANANRSEENLFSETPPYMPTVTSYDYDAPLSEAAEITAKYNATVEIMKKYNPKFRLTPEEREYLDSKTPKTKNYGELSCRKYLPLSDVLATIIKPLGTIEKPINVENLCQQIAGTCSSPLYGFVGYQYKGDFKATEKLSISGILRDRMQILLDGKLLTTIYANFDNYNVSAEIQLTESGRNLLLLVENMGRINFDRNPNKLNNHRKGFMGNIHLNDLILKNWSVYDLSLKPSIIESILKSDKWREFQIDSIPSITQPAFYRFSGDLSSANDDVMADTFVNIQGWTKGVLFVNNNNLGRYWNIGPAKTLYLPGPYLTHGSNDIILLELHKPWLKITLQEKSDLGEPCELPCFSP